MADKKISELDAISGSATASDDLFLIVDSSGSVTKKISREELNNAIEQDVLSTVDINGGTIDSTVIGGTTPAAGDFTTLGATGNITVGGTVDGRDVATDGSKLDGIAASATANPNAIDNVVDDTTPQLGGNLDLNGNDITGTGNIDVTGTVTADGLTVDTNTLHVDATNNLVGVNTTSPNSITGTGIKNIVIGDGSANAGAVLNAGSASFGSYAFALNNALDGRFLYSSANGLQVETGGTQRMRIDRSTGDISFYADNGTTQGFFWDASTQRLGLGSTSPQSAVDIDGTGDVAVRYANSGTFKGYVGVATSAGNLMSGSATDELIVRSTDGIAFAANNARAMTITSGGSVGIGAASPDSYDASANNLVIYEAGNAGITIAGGTSNNGSIYFADGTSGDDPYRGAIQYQHSGNLMYFRTNSAERMRIDSSGNLLVGKTASDTGATAGLEFSGTYSQIRATTSGNPSIRLNRLSTDGTIAEFRKDGTIVGVIGTQNWGIGTASPARVPLHVHNPSTNAAEIHLTNATSGSTNGDGLTISQSGVNASIFHRENGYLRFATNNTEAARLDASGNLLVGTTSTSDTLANTGVELRSDGRLNATRSLASGGSVIYVNRQAGDGVLVSFRQDGTEEGYISVSGTTVSYNGGHLSRWSRLADDSKDTSIVKGTVMTNLNEMVEWSHETTYWTDEDELPVDEDGNPTVSVGDVKTAAYVEDNEQLNKMAVSSVEGDANVAGVFVNWDSDDDEFNDMNIAMTGDMVIRIAQGTTVQRGDLLMSAGDGTAKPQGDDIVRSKTIAKVTSTHVSHTYDDGSYLVPCVLMAC